MEGFLLKWWTVCMWSVEGTFNWQTNLPCRELLSNTKKKSLECFVMSFYCWTTSLSSNSHSIRCTFVPHKGFLNAFVASQLFCLCTKAKHRCPNLWSASHQTLLHSRLHRVSYPQATPWAPVIQVCNYMNCFWPQPLREVFFLENTCCSLHQGFIE